MAKEYTTELEPQAGFLSPVIAIWPDGLRRATPQITSGRLRAASEAQAAEAEEAAPPRKMQRMQRIFGQGRLPCGAPWLIQEFLQAGRSPIVGLLISGKKVLQPTVAVPENEPIIVEILKQLVDGLTTGDAQKK